MYNIEDFNKYIKETHGKNLIFICNDQIQKIVNNNTIYTIDN